MDDEQAWLIPAIKALANERQRFSDRAFFEGLATMATEQLKRLDQSTGELDGRIWNPKKWG